MIEKKKLIDLLKGKVKEVAHMERIDEYCIEGDGFTLFVDHDAEYDKITLEDFEERTYIDPEDIKVGGVYKMSYENSHDDETIICTSDTGGYHFLGENNSEYHTEFPLNLYTKPGLTFTRKGA